MQYTAKCLGQGCVKNVALLLPLLSERLAYTHISTQSRLYEAFLHNFIGPISRPTDNNFPYFWPLRWPISKIS